MAKRLLDLTIDEVSAVDKGANDAARIELWKRDSLRDRSLDRSALPAVRKHDCEESERELIHKCLEALDAGDLHHVTKRDFEESLDILAKRLSTQTGRTYAAAYSELLRADLGQELFAGLEACQQAGRY